MIELNDDINFDLLINVIGSRILVDFFQPACAPCRALEPSLKEIEKENKIVVLKVNVDDYPKIALKYGVQSLPALILFEGGRPSRQLMESPTRAALQRFVK